MINFYENCTVVNAETEDFSIREIIGYFNGKERKVVRDYETILEIVDMLNDYKCKKTHLHSPVKDKVIIETTIDGEKVKFTIEWE